ncbi:MFS transporter [Candidatus Chloroploca sp. Khr17]|uniref:MFS transporter n=1 Tax=Candidatus Chloroploca sp. Khr17 TaxID=2496869 RepID=UPI00101D8628|nr:MFS transporter [Candidatus Chloroploca sp. Khr17]
MQLHRAARRYLLATALLTTGLAIRMLFLNLLLVELGYDRQTVALPLISDLPLLGLFNSLPVLTGVLSSLPLWWLVTRTGPVVGLFGGGVLYAMSLVLTASSTAPLPLALGLALAGPASVLATVSAAPFMMRYSADATGRNRLFALNAGFALGFAGLGSLVGGLLPGFAAILLALPQQSAAAYQATFVVASIIGVIGVWPLALNLREGEAEATHERAAEVSPGTGRPSPRLEGMRTEARTFLTAGRYALPFLISPLLISTGAALLIPFLNLYFRQQFGASDAVLGFIFALIGIVTGMATLGAPWLVRYLGQMGSVIATQLLAIPCLIMLGLAPTLALAFAVALVRAALMNMAAPLYDVYAMERTPEAARPIVIGLIKGALSAGYLFGPPLSAQVQRDYGFGPLFTATAILYACAALVNLGLMRSRVHG